MSVSTHAGLARLKKLVLLERRDLTLIVIFTLGTDLLMLVTPVAVQNFVNNVAFGMLIQPLIVLSTLMVAGLGFSAFLTALETYVIEIIQRRLFSRSTHAMAKALGHETRQDYGISESTLVHRFFEVVSLQKSASLLLVDGLAISTQTLIGLIILAFYHPWFLVFGAVISIALYFVVVVMGRRALDTAKNESKEKYAVAAALEQILQHPHAPVEMRSTLSTYFEARKFHFRVVFKQHIGGLFIYAVASAGLLALGGALVINRQLSLGQLVAAELILGVVMVGLIKLGKVVDAYYDFVTSLYKLDQVLGQTALEAPTDGHTETPRRVRVYAQRIKWALVAVILISLFLPWRQTASGTGRVIAYAPRDRQQMVSAPVEGRVTQWFVREGSSVKAGDVIVELTDNDPEILTRLQEERNALQTRLEAAEERASSIQYRIEHLSDSRMLALSAGSSRVQMAANRVRAAAQALDAAEATLLTAELNLKRQESLFQQGLTSKRNVEVAQLEHTRARTEVDRADASLEAARSEQIALKMEQQRFGTDGSASVQDARAAHKVALAEAAQTKAEIARIEVRLARQRTQRVQAPRDGVILRLLVQPQAEVVKPGDALAILVPNADDRAVEIWVDGNDAPLITDGREVRLQFEGWPALQFSGWPSVAVGTFPGRVALVDATDNGTGLFRVLVVPQHTKNHRWPSGRYLRQGVRANGWVLLNNVPVGYEIWRQLNGFPPSAVPPSSDLVKIKKEVKVDKPQSPLDRDIPEQELPDFNPRK